MRYSTPLVFKNKEIIADLVTKKIKAHVYLSLNFYMEVFIMRKVILCLLTCIFFLISFSSHTLARAGGGNNYSSGSSSSSSSSDHYYDNYYYRRSYRPESNNKFSFLVFTWVLQLYLLYFYYH